MTKIFGSYTTKQIGIDIETINLKQLVENNIANIFSSHFQNKYDKYTSGTKQLMTTNITSEQVEPKMDLLNNFKNEINKNFNIIFDIFNFLKIDFLNRCYDLLDENEIKDFKAIYNKKLENRKYELDKKKLLKQTNNKEKTIQEKQKNTNDDIQDKLINKEKITKEKITKEKKPIFDEPKSIVYIENTFWEIDFLYYYIKKYLNNNKIFFNKITNVFFNNDIKYEKMSSYIEIYEKINTVLNGVDTNKYKDMFEKLIDICKKDKESPSDELESD